MSDLCERLRRLANPGEDGRGGMPIAKEAADEIASLRAQLDKALAGLEQIFSVGDGWHPNTKSRPAGTTGEGHAMCRQIAQKTLAALSDETGK